MTTITRSPRTPDTNPATVAVMQFLAPPATEGETPETRAPDRGEPAMGQLRQPFAVAPDTTPGERRRA